MPASPTCPLTGGCLCGAVRFEVRAPFETAGYCHCTRCQRRTGTGSSVNGRVAADAFAIVEGAPLVRTWTPPDGQPKSFCAECGGHLFSGPSAHGTVGVRLGAIDGDPGIRPQWRQWTESAAVWEPLPDDGLPSHPQRRPHGG
ncbi:MAG TPA: GFA family protein [Capillimicrobium sp.]|nr:GFA family protein [Capillimicrobium sp.]